MSVDVDALWEFFLTKKHKLIELNDRFKELSDKYNTPSYTKQNEEERVKLFDEIRKYLEDNYVKNKYLIKHYVPQIQLVYVCISNGPVLALQLRKEFSDEKGVAEALSGIKKLYPELPEDRLDIQKYAIAYAA